MNYLIKIFFIFAISLTAKANQIEKNEVIFEINNIAFTKIDLEKRILYIELANKLNYEELNENQKKDIYDDYISSLIFYEYYKKNNINFKNLNDDLNQFFEKYLKVNKSLKEKNLNDFRKNIKIDLVRKKLLEEILNTKKNNLLKTANYLDLLYNFNINYIILKKNSIPKNLLQNINNREEFSVLKNYLNEKNIKYFYKDENINDYYIASEEIKEIIENDVRIKLKEEKEFITIISIEKNLESYEGIFVKLINFSSEVMLEKESLNCNYFKKLNEQNKTIFKEYEYSKLNNNIKNNLKSINDFIIIKDNKKYNYIFLCELNYDEEKLNTINFNKKLNTMIIKIQKKFINKYKKEYGFKKI